MGLIIVKRSQLVELVVPASATNQTRFNFPDQPQINRDGMVIDAIESLCVSDMSHSPNQNPLISEAVLKFSYLTMYVSQSADTQIGQGEQLNQIPLSILHRSQGGTAPFVRDMFGLPALRLDWSKSYISTGQPIGVEAVTSYLFNVYYHNVDKGLGTKKSRFK